MKNQNGQNLYNRAKNLIPGGTQLLSKRPEMFAPNQWPPYYTSASGCRIRDIDGNTYTDMSTMGIGSCLLGYADPVVNNAVIQAVHDGTMSTLNSPQEVELAELLISLHPWADMVRYARSGGEIMAIAIRIARAATGRDRIAFCGYHGWHDWYLAANITEGDDDNLDGQLLPGLAPTGVPSALGGTIFPFHYNNIEELEDIISRYGESVGVIVMEPFRYKGPKDNFLQQVKKIAKKNNSVLIFDEITSGWRHHVGGVHMKLGVEPDIAVFAKSVSNGVPMAAVIGKRSVMDHAQNSFISSTYWTERIGPSAALAAIKEYQRRNIPEIVKEIGTRIQNIWESAAETAGITLEVEGPPALSHFSFKYENANTLKTLLTQELLKHSILGTTAFYTSAAHDQQALNDYEQALHKIFPLLKKALDENRVEELLEGPVAHTGFARLT